ncbi:vacuolar protein sorting-associated protein 13 [Kipferlia bialata]|uniref:Vacuolar protein sorting-associated protein 13 n=1 Tax=Kipferlia bialata TaxID=797122 RepID=A0A9K3CM49_9EUKA|nr:vacuolar protein sorting-associated protein 13 [Kipferlia bialata]|eukprot:g323.t1
MIESAVASVLAKVLGDFVVVDREDLSVSLSSGHLELRDVEFNKEALSTILPGLSIVGGCIHLLSLRIPWTRPAKGIKVHCDGVYALLGPPGPEAGVYTAEDIQEALEMSLQKKAKMLEEWHKSCILQIQGKTETGLVSRLVSAVATRMTPLVVDQVRVELTDIHMRFEDTASESPIAVGATMESLTVCSTTSRWEPLGVSATVAPGGTGSETHTDPQTGGHTDTDTDTDTWWHRRRTQLREWRERRTERRAHKRDMRTSSSTDDDKATTNKTTSAYKLLKLTNLAVYACPIFQGVSLLDQGQMDAMRHIEVPSSECLFGPSSMEIRLSLGTSSVGTQIAAAAAMSSVTCALSDHQVVCLSDILNRVFSVHPLSYHVGKRIEEQRAIHVGPRSAATYVNLYYSTLSRDLRSSGRTAAHIKSQKDSLERWIPYDDLIRYREAAATAIRGQGVVDMSSLSRKSRKTVLAQMSVDMCASEVARLSGKGVPSHDRAPQRHVEGTGTTLTLDVGLDHISLSVSEYSAVHTHPEPVDTDALVGVPYQSTTVASLHIHRLLTDIMLSADDMRLTGIASVGSVTLTDTRGLADGIAFPHLVSTLHPTPRVVAEGRVVGPAFLSLECDVMLQSHRDMGSLSVSSLPLLVVVQPPFLSRMVLLSDRVVSQIQRPEAVETGPVSEAGSDTGRPEATLQEGLSAFDVLAALRSGDTDSVLARPDETEQTRDTAPAEIQDTTLSYCTDLGVFKSLVHTFRRRATPHSHLFSTRTGVKPLLSRLSTKLYIARSLGIAEVPGVYLFAALGGLDVTVSHGRLFGVQQLIGGLIECFIVPSHTNTAPTPIACLPESSTAVSPNEDLGSAKVNVGSLVSALTESADDTNTRGPVLTSVDLAVEALTVTVGEGDAVEFSAAVTSIRAKADVRAAQSEAVVEVATVRVLNNAGVALVTAGVPQSTDGSQPFVSVAYSNQTGVADILGSAPSLGLQTVDVGVSQIDVVLDRDSLNRISAIAEETLGMLALPSVDSQGVGTAETMSRETSADTVVVETDSELVAKIRRGSGKRREALRPHYSMVVNASLTGVSTLLCTSLEPLSTVTIDRVSCSVGLCANGSLYIEADLGDLGATDMQEGTLWPSIVYSTTRHGHTHLDPLLSVSMVKDPTSPYAQEVHVDIPRGLGVVYVADYVQRVTDFFSAHEEDSAAIKGAIAKTGAVVGETQTQLRETLVQPAQTSLMKFSLTRASLELIVPKWIDKSDHVRMRGTGMSVDLLYDVRETEHGPVPVRAIDLSVYGFRAETSIGTDDVMEGADGVGYVVTNLLAPVNANVFLESPLGSMGPSEDTCVSVCLYQGTPTTCDMHPLVATLTRQQYLFLSSLSQPGTNLGGEPSSPSSERAAGPVSPAENISTGNSIVGQVMLDSQSHSASVSLHTSCIEVRALPTPISSILAFVAPLADSSPSGSDHSCVTRLGSPSSLQSPLTETAPPPPQNIFQLMGALRGEPEDTTPVLLVPDTMVVPVSDSPLFVGLGRFLCPVSTGDPGTMLHHLPEGYVRLSVVEPSLASCSTLMGHSQSEISTVTVQCSTSVRLMVPEQVDDNSILVCLEAVLSTDASIVMNQFERGTGHNTSASLTVEGLSLRVLHEEIHRDDGILKSGILSITVQEMGLQPDPSLVAAAFPQPERGPRATKRVSDQVCAMFAEKAFVDVRACLEDEVAVSVGGTAINTIRRALVLSSQIGHSSDDIVDVGQDHRDDGQDDGLFKTETPSGRADKADRTTYSLISLQVEKVRVFLMSRFNHPLLKLKVPGVSVSLQARRDTLEASLETQAHVRYFDPVALAYHYLLQPISISASVSQAHATIQRQTDTEESSETDTESSEADSESVESGTVCSTHVTLDIRGSESETVYIHLPEPAVAALAAAGEALGTDVVAESTSTTANEASGVTEFLCVNHTGVPFVLIAHTESFSPDDYMPLSDFALSCCAFGDMGERCTGIYSQVQSSVAEAARAQGETCVVSWVEDGDRATFDLASEGKPVGSILFGDLFEPLVGVSPTKPGVFAYTMVPREASGLAMASVPVVITVRRVGMQTLVDVSSKYSLTNMFLSPLRLSVQNSSEEGGESTEVEVLVPPGHKRYLPLMHTLAPLVGVSVALCAGGTAIYTKEVPTGHYNAFLRSHAYNETQHTISESQHAEYQPSEYIPVGGRIIGSVTCKPVQEGGRDMHIGHSLSTVSVLTAGSDVGPCEYQDRLRHLYLFPTLRIVNDCIYPITVVLSTLTMPPGVVKKKHAIKERMLLKIGANSNLDVPLVHPDQRVAINRIALDVGTGYDTTEFSRDFTRVGNVPLTLWKHRGHTSDHVPPEVKLKGPGERRLRIGVEFDGWRDTGGTALLRIFPPYLVRNSLSDHTVTTTAQPITGLTSFAVDPKEQRVLREGDTCMFGYSSLEYADQKEGSKTQGLPKAKLLCVAIQARPALSDVDGVQLAGRVEPFHLQTGIMTTAGHEHTPLGVPCLASTSLCCNGRTKIVSIEYRCTILNYSHRDIDCLVGPAGNSGRVREEYGHVSVAGRATVPVIEGCVASADGEVYLYFVDPSAYVSSSAPTGGILSVFRVVDFLESAPLIPGLSAMVPYGINLDVAGVHDVLVPTVGQGVPLRLTVKVDVEAGRSSVKVYSTRSDAPAPYRVESLCPFDVCVSQSMEDRETEHPLESITSLGSPTVQTVTVHSTVVPAMGVSDFFLHDPNMPHRMHVKSADNTQTAAVTFEGDFDLTTHLRKIRQHRYSGTSVYTVLVFDGQTRRVYLCPTKAEAEECRLKYSSRRIYTAEREETRLLLFVPRICVFAYITDDDQGPASKRAECMCVTVDQPELEARDCGGVQSLRLKLRGVQLDNQHLRGSLLYPVVLRIGEELQISASLANSRYEPDPDAPPAVVLKVDGVRHTSNPARNVTSYEGIWLDIGGVYMAAEQSFLETVSVYAEAVAASLSQTLSSRATLARLGQGREGESVLVPRRPPQTRVEQTDPDMLTAATGASGVFVEQIHVSDTPICLTLKLLDPLNTLAGGFMEGVLNSGISAAALENAHLELPKLKAKGVYGHVDQVLASLLGFYVSAFSSDVLGILGIGASTSLLGNAPRALGSLSAGVVELGTSDSAVKGITGFARHTATTVTTIVSNVSGSVGETLVRTAANDGFTDRHKRALKKSKTSMTSAVNQSAKGVVDGFSTGLTGVYKCPQRALERRGKMGLPKGVKKGLVQCIAAPAAGLVNVLAYTTASLHSSVSVSAVVPVFDPKHYLVSDALLRQEEPKGAEGTEGTQDVDDTQRGGIGRGEEGADTDL